MLDGEARWQSSSGDYLLPAYLLASLDYARAGSTEDRIRRYSDCLEKMGDLQLYEQLMLRLRQEADAEQGASKIDPMSLL